MCCLAPIHITLTVYLGIFALDNPDADGWYGTISGVPRMDSEASFKAIVDQATVADLDHVHDHFVTWFLWGFINAVGTAVALLLVY